MTTSAVPLSALRIVSYVPLERDAVHVGLLSSDAQHVVDLAPLGFGDAFDALARTDTLRRTAGAIMHGAARQQTPVRQVHLVAPIPMARSVVRHGTTERVQFAEPTTLHGPGSHLTREHAASAVPGLAAVVGSTLHASSSPDQAELDDALIGSLLVMGWAHDPPDASDSPAVPATILAGAVGPFVGVPLRHPDSLTIARISPEQSDLAATTDEHHDVVAPRAEEFVALARQALATHSLHAGDLLVIFPGIVSPSTLRMRAGCWVRVSAPGLGTLSLAVR
jgi:hypothetical protein